MVSQIIWLDVRDVFTQVAKDVVGQGLYHGKRSPRGLLHNQCGVSGGTTAFSDVTEGKEKQMPVSRRSTRGGSSHHREESIPFNVHDATSIFEFSSSQLFLMLFRDSLGTTETERNALVIEDFS
ncbi:hypothetical protein YC2023_045314 [Brassica napus]